MKYHLYDENYTHKGTFESLQKMRNFLCEKSMTMMIDHIWMILLIILNLLSGIGT